MNPWKTFAVVAATVINVTVFISAVVGLVVLALDDKEARREATWDFPRLNGRRIPEGTGHQWW